MTQLTSFFETGPQGFKSVLVAFSLLALACSADPGGSLDAAGGHPSAGSGGRAEGAGGESAAGGQFASGGGTGGGKTSGGSGGTVGTGATSGGGAASASGGRGGSGGGGPRGPVTLNELLPDLPEFVCEGEDPCAEGACEEDPSPCEGFPVIRTEADLEDFRHCTSVQGVEFALPELTELGPLALQTVTYDLTIDGNDKLTSLAGLENLVSVGQHLVISENAALEGDLSGLESLVHVGGDLTILLNPKLESLSGPHLAHLNGKLTLYENETLSDISALGSLTCLGSLWVAYNDVLMNLEPLGNITELRELEVVGASSAALTGLEGLTTVTGDVSLGVSSLHGLQGLRAVGGTLSASGSPDLVNLSGLENLRSIGGDLNVNSGIYLASFEGLDQLSVIGGDFEVGAGFEDFVGLENLLAIGGSVDAYFAELESLEGLVSAIPYTILSMPVLGRVSHPTIAAICSSLIETSTAPSFATSAWTRRQNHSPRGVTAGADLVDSVEMCE